MRSLSLFVPALTAFCLGLTAIQTAGAQSAGDAQPQLADVACWKTLAEHFRQHDGHQLYRPLPTLQPLKGHHEIAFDYRFELGTVAIGDHLVHHVPVARIKPAQDNPDHGDFYVDFYDESGGARRCIIPQEAYGDSPEARSFQRDWGMSGARLLLEQGDAVNYHVTSEVDYSKVPDASKPYEAPFGGAAGCDNINVHTHGLIVRPSTPTAQTPTYGDYVLQTVRPETSAVDPCAPKTPSGSAAGGHMHGGAQTPTFMNHHIVIPGAPDDPPDRWKEGKGHPSGFYFFHPHPHGYSAMQFGGGTTGLITIGSMNYAPKPDPALSGSKGQNLRHIMLKDTQLVPSATKGEWDFSARIDPALCSGKKSKLSDSGAPKGYWPGGICPGDKDRQWLFTVNGELDPLVTDTDVETTEIWRIANASATVSYSLSIVDASKPLDDNPTPKPISLQILSKDGAAIASPTKADRIYAERIFLMPGARVEFAFRLPNTANGEYALVTSGAKTGGDTWEPVRLAHIKWKGSNVPPAATGPEAESVIATAVPARAERSILGAVIDRKGTPAPDRPDLDAKTRNACAGVTKSEERIVYFVKNKNVTNTKAGNADLFGIITGVRKRGESLSETKFYLHKGADDYKTFTQTDEATVRSLNSTAVLPDGQYPAPGKNYPGFGQDQDLSTICTTRASNPHARELWVIENWTNEIHNFHLHQSKFFIADVDKDDYAHYFNFPCDHGADCTPTDQDIVKFYDSLKTAGHDTVPIPRAMPNDSNTCSGDIGAKGCNPGRVAIAIPFNRDEMLHGDFVYHCHILEHEDHGMMGAIKVVPEGEQAIMK
jgi:FtsP/CotA-like multicopper oxidase with cupredoxin domain